MIQQYTNNTIIQLGSTQQELANNLDDGNQYILPGNWRETESSKTA
jgi:hypothetical protein